MVKKGAKKGKKGGGAKKKEKAPPLDPAAVLRDLATTGGVVCNPDGQVCSVARARACMREQADGASGAGGIGVHALLCVFSRHD